MTIDVVTRLLGLLRPEWRLVVVSVVSRISNNALSVAIPAVAAGFVVSAAEVGTPGVGEAVATLGGLALVKGGFRYLEQFTGHAVAFRLLAVLRNEVFRWLKRLEPGSLESDRSGDLVARVAGDIDRLEPFYAHTIAPLASAICVPAIAIVGLALVVGPGPSLALTPFVIAYLAVPWLGLSGSALARSEARRLSGESAGALADLVQGSREIAILGAVSRVMSATARSDRVLATLTLAQSASSARRSLIGWVISGGALIAVTVVSASEYTSGEVTLAGLCVSIVVAWAVMTPLRALEQIAPDSASALVSAARLFELEDRAPQTYGTAGFDSAAPADVRFHAVTVTAGGANILESVDLVVGDGAFVGVVGPSGSGKSTLVQTLVRYRDPESGHVSLGDRIVLDLAPGVLSQAIAVVPQRPDIFFGSVASNLEVARPGATEQQMLHALERACLLSWLGDLEAGLDTPIGELGLGLSGGQIQRLALARVFLRDPKVLILDEATSELDSGTERAILDGVLADRGSRTVIVVAHRMETLVSADLILVMDGGRLVETGTHLDLRSAGGLYSHLWARHDDVLVEGSTTGY
jgi:ABC-type multidrug transport system fused ATPase/permease subunit